MTPKVKICGLRREEDIDAANALRPDFIGFVFARDSTRRISPGAALALRRRLSPEIKAVGVFAGASVGEIAAVCRSGAIDIVQLHGGADDERLLTALRSALPGVPVIRAFKVADEANLAEAEATAADHVLLDAGSGSGRVFDWTLLARRPLGRPFFLAGGLGPENVAEAVALVHPFAVDASSSLETGGFKDYAKMERFIQEVRK